MKELVWSDFVILDGDFVIQMKALTFPVICSPVAIRLDINEFQHLEGLEFADEIDGRSEMIDILLGADYYEVVTGEIIKGDTGPTAVASKFAWLLTGPVKLRGAVPTYTAANLVINGNGATQLPGDNNHALSDALRKFWDLESLGIIETAEEKEREFMQDIKFSSPRYEVGLPWKDGEANLETVDGR